MAKIDLAAFRQHEADGLVTCREHLTLPLVIWNYTPRCQFGHEWDDVTEQARGLITEHDGTIVARPFRKFWNYLERADQQLPLEPFKVTEKMDGSLIILCRYQGQIVVATRGSFLSEQAQGAQDIVAQKYADFPFLDGYTYLFEYLAPDNRIVVDYGNLKDLVLLAVIETETGAEIDIHALGWPFPVVRRYDGITDFAELKAHERENMEGFVVRFESGLRVKIKLDDYVRLHRILTGVNAKTIWELLRHHQSFDDLLDHVPDEFYAWVLETKSKLLREFGLRAEVALGVYEQVRHLPTRKDQALCIQTLVSPQYAPVVFRMLDGGDYDDIIWKQLLPEAERPFAIDNEG